MNGLSRFGWDCHGLLVEFKNRRHPVPRGRPQPWELTNTTNTSRVVGGHHQDRPLERFQERLQISWTPISWRPLERFQERLQISWTPISWRPLERFQERLQISWTPISWRASGRSSPSFIMTRAQDSRLCLTVRSERPDCQLLKPAHDSRLCLTQFWLKDPIEAGLNWKDVSDPATMVAFPIIIGIQIMLLLWRDHGRCPATLYSAPTQVSHMHRLGTS